jgi:hypothetical protein
MKILPYLMKRKLHLVLYPLVLFFLWLMSDTFVALFLSPGFVFWGAFSWDHVRVIGLVVLWLVSALVLTQHVVRWSCAMHSQRKS